MPKFNSTLTNNATGKSNTTEHPTRRKAAQHAATALYDNNPRMSKQDAQACFEVMLTAGTDTAAAIYGDYTAHIELTK